MKDWSAPAVTVRPARRAASQSQSEEDKQVDYSHLDIVSEIEQITGCTLRHVSKEQYSARCPFPGCPSRNNAFCVWDRPVLELTRDGKREKHFYCRRCDRSGDIIGLLRQYREATGGEVLTWSEAARLLRIDPRTWRAFADGQDGEQPAVTSSRERRKQSQEAARKAEQAELAMLDAVYTRARAALAAGQITRADGSTIQLNLARDYLAARGFTLEQSAALGLAYLPTRQEIGGDQGEQLGAWRGRLLFPLAAAGGRRGYAGRTLWRWQPGMSTEQHKSLLDTWNERQQDASKWVPRTKKTRAGLAYYGYEDACNCRTLILVEGEFDAASVRLALSGVPGVAVVAMGLHFSAREIPLNVLTVVLALDGDAAGQEHLEQQMDELAARGVDVTIARPGAGKDWNDNHLLAGLDSIKATILQAAGIQAASSPGIERQNSLGTCKNLQKPAMAGDQRIRPSGYETGEICLCCGEKVDEREGFFMLDGDDLYCIDCWQQQAGQVVSGQDAALCRDIPESEHQAQTEAEEGQAFLAQVHSVFGGEVDGKPVWPGPFELGEPLHNLDSAEYIENRQPGLLLEDNNEALSELEGERRDDEDFSAANNLCKKHGKPLEHSDEMGGRYCKHVDCWQRYQLIRAGAAAGYPALAGVLDPRDYLPDTSREPLRYSEQPGGGRVPIYPARPPIYQQIIAAGSDAWRAYVLSQSYHAIDVANKAVIASAS